MNGAPKAKASGAATAAEMQQLFEGRLAESRDTFPQYCRLLPGEAEWRAAFRAWEKRTAALSAAAAGEVIFAGMTREELYDAIWQNTLRVVALRHGISDNGLRKVCKKYKIEMPARGYWARVRARNAARLEA